MACSYHFSSPDFAIKDFLSETILDVNYYLIKGERYLRGAHYGVSNVNAFSIKISDSDNFEELKIAALDFFTNNITALRKLKEYGSVGGIVHFGVKAKTTTFHVNIFPEELIHVMSEFNLKLDFTHSPIE